MEARGTQEEKTALYRHFDRDGALLYVGISNSAAARLAQHMNGSQWAADIANVKIEYHANRRAAIEAERMAIRQEKPRWNITHNKIPEKQKPGCPSVRIAPKVPWDDCATEAAIYEAVIASKLIRIVKKNAAVLVNNLSMLDSGMVESSFYLAEPSSQTVFDLLDGAFKSFNTILPNARKIPRSIYSVRWTKDEAESTDTFFSMCISSHGAFSACLKDALGIDIQYDIAYRETISAVADEYAEAIIKLTGGLH